jgi:spoIIIJ-associated protein
MSKEIFEGATVETALTRASEKFEVETSQLEHRLVSENQDFWGDGEGTVTIEAWVRAEQNEETVELETTKSEVQPESLPDEDDDAAEPVAKTGNGEPFDSDTPPVAPAETAAEEPQADSHDRGGEEDASTNVVDTQEDDGASAPQAARGSATEELEVGPEVISNLLQQIFHDMEFNCTVEIEAQPDGFLATISGDDKEVLLEGNGRSLSALELLINNAFRHKLPRGNKISVDAGDFRSRRDEELSDLAFQVAHSAKESGETQETQPLNPYERRLVHLALAEDARVTTRSRGNGFMKNVQVIPQGNGRGNRGGGQGRHRRG